MRRLSAEEKGKAKVQDNPRRPRIRIRASDLDTSRLIRENALTLIGRVTNRREQNMASLLPYLTRKWDLVGKIHGSDLGNDCFQFRFQDEKEMRTVLENRPYQFNRWMIILQQWEPIISPTFPSQIPFWISLKGIPLHFWDDKILRDIGQEFGHLESYILTKTSARVQIMMDGLKPIPQDTVLEFSGGAECIITLEYEKLENFCTYCLKLSHLAQDCPDKHNSDSNELYRGEAPYKAVTEQARSNRSIRHPSPPRPYRETAFHQRLDRHGNPYGERAATYQSRAPPLRNKITPNVEPEAPQQRRTERKLPHRREATDISPQYSHRRHTYGREHLNLGVRSPIEQQWRAKEQDTGHSGGLERPTVQRRLPLERNLEKEDFPPPPPSLVPQTRTTEEIMEELREVTYQYTNCPDPVESEARRQRVLDGEVNGLMEQTAATILAREREMQQEYINARAAETGDGAETGEEIDMVVEQNTTIPLEVPIELPLEPQQSKRRGRPPKSKQREIRVSPKVFKGSNSRKRNLQAAKGATASPARQPSGPSNRHATRFNDLGNTAASSSTAVPPRPPAKIFPASNRQPRDFPRQSPPLP